MNKTHLEMKVGLFVLVALALLAALLLQFSKGTTFLRGTYELRLRASNVGGLKPRSAVLLAGVQVGAVSDVRLGPGATNVLVLLKIYSKFQIHRDARFVIEQSGFLGDQYVAVIPTDNLAPLLQDHDEVTCQEPFNLQEVARSASGFIKRIDDTARKLDAAVADVRRLVLNEQTLTNLSVTVGNFREVSARALKTVDNLDALVNSNSTPISASVSNLVFFSQELNHVAETAGAVIATNSTDISAAVKNIESSTVVMKKLLDDLQAGKGLAGSLLQNQAMADDVAAVASNLAVTSSNLNRLGLWGILWQHKPPRANAPPARPLTSPRDSSQ